VHFKVFCLGIISSSITISFVVVSFKSSKLFFMPFRCSHLLVSCVARSILICRSLEDWRSDFKSGKLTHSINQSFHYFPLLVSTILFSSISILLL
jgi:hypothetical protein